MPLHPIASPKTDQWGSHAASTKPPVPDCDPQQHTTRFLQRSPPPSRRKPDASEPTARRREDPQHAKKNECIRECQSTPGPPPSPPQACLNFAVPNPPPRVHGLHRRKRWLLTPPPPSLPPTRPDAQSLRPPKAAPSPISAPGSAFRLQYSSVISKYRTT